MPGTLKKTQSALGRLAWVMLQAKFAEADSLSKEGGFLWSITMEVLEHKKLSFAWQERHLAQAVALSHFFGGGVPLFW
jgi:hypothetical protein